MNDEEQVKKALREACGFIDPLPAPPVQKSSLEETLERANAIWDQVMAEGGRIPSNIFGKD